MIFKDYYKILGLETSRVTMDEIRMAYRSAAKKNHPDLNIGNVLAEEKIKDINEAYRVLSVPATKRKYDRKWNMYVGNKRNLFNKDGNSKEVLKNMFFGADAIEMGPFKPHDKNAKKGENIETAISISIPEAFNGTDKKISLKNHQGKAKTYSITIPKGIRQNEKIRLIGQGKPGENGGNPGDLIIRINIVDDKKYSLKGDDVYTVLRVTPWEAALGRKLKLKGIDNEENKLMIMQGTQGGDMMVLENQGYVKEDGTRGNMIVEVRIMIPKILTAEEKSIFEKLDKLSKFNPRKAEI